MRRCLERFFPKMSYSFNKCGLSFPTLPVFYSVGHPHECVFFHLVHRQGAEGTVERVRLWR